MFHLIKQWLGGSNEAEVKRLSKIVAQVEARAGEMKALSHTALQRKTAEFRERFAAGETLDLLLPEAFAVVSEAAQRTIGQTPFPEQMMGGIVLHQGRIAEMKTGEGKTLTATLAAYLNAIAGLGVHIVTVNDYLARFQGEWMGQIYRYLGMSVGLILHDMENDVRRASYAADITYGTNNEFGFDYLRDNMVVHKDDMVQRGHVFAVVDEVDSILIDEARTPLIISGQGEKSTEMYVSVDRFVARLREGADFEKDEKLKALNLTEEGVAKAERHFGVANLGDIENTELNHHIHQALKARFIMKLDVDYVVKDGEVVIVDEFTGRLMTGRRYSEGLHQAIEAKENVTVARESKTLATITFQNYFRMYKKLSGMTGTAKTEEEEFRGIYSLDVVQIPTHKPMIRKDMDDRIYQTEGAKYRAVVEEIIACNKRGQPVLVGTVSVEKNEALSRMLELRGVPHVLLNAKHHEREAEIVAQAGKLGAVTIATNMAGRGTDILLGGNPEFMARQAMRQAGYEEHVIEESLGHAEDAPQEVLEARVLIREKLAEFRKETDAEHERVVAVGGLAIIGTERHESRRIDNQLRGRSGRQGDPGTSRFYIALDDDLMRRFGGDRIAPMISKLGLSEDEAIEYGLLSKQIESAQKRVEGNNFDRRKHVLQYDDVMNKQREIIYGQRRQVLEGQDMKKVVLDMMAQLIKERVDAYLGKGAEEDEWDVAGLDQELARLCLAPGDVAALGPGKDREELTAALVERARAIYAGREMSAKKAGVDMRDVERDIMLRIVDLHWMDHIDAMDQLREGIGLRAYGQKDPIVAFKFEGFEMFEAMVASIREEAIRTLFHIAFEQRIERRQVAIPQTATHGGEEEQSAKPAAARPAHAGQSVGRNDPCPCGSGKKYKHCHGK